MLSGYEEVSHEITEPSRNVNKQRLTNMSTAEIDEITTKAETKNTKWAAQVFERKM